MEGKRVSSFISTLPKVELHIHFEGSVGPQWLAGILEDRRIPSGEQIGELYRFRDFPGFLQAYRRVNELLSEPEDFYHIARAIAVRLADQRILYAELTYTPLLHTRQGLDHRETMGCILEGFEAARREGKSPRINFIYDTVRQWGAGAALETVEFAASDLAAGLPVVGFGVGGDELSAPARELEEAFSLAESRGLRKFVHAGEVGEAGPVWEAVEILGAHRIGHGIAAIKDEKLMKVLAERRIALDICLTSNVLTGAVKSFAGHPWLELIKAGVGVTLGSDDPGFFGVWLEDELEKAARTWNLDYGMVGQLMESAVRYSFLSEKEKKSLIAGMAPKAAEDTLFQGGDL
jgi:aminodeoxyfutalosine deaminase